MAILRGTDVSPRVIDEPKAVVLFTRTTCRACNNVVKLLEQISEEMPDVRMVHVVEDKTRGAMMFGKGLKRLSGWPCTLVYRNGIRVDMFFGIETVMQYRQRIKKALRV